MPRDTRPRGDTKPRGASRVGAFLFAAGVFFAGYAAGTCSAAHGAAQLAAQQQRQAMREVDAMRNAQAMRWASDRGPASVPPEKVARRAVPPAEKGGSLDDGWWGFGATGYEKDDTSFYANCTQGWNYLRGDCKIMQSFDIGIDEGTFQVDLWLNPTNTAPLLFKPFLRARTAPGLRAIGQRRGPQASRPQAALQHRQPAAPALRLLRHILLREGLAGRGVDAESASRSSILSTAWAPALVCARRRRVTMEFIIPCAWSDAHAGRAVSAAAGPALGGGGALPPYTPQYE
eukprot:CAMPEP_0202738696 /NCGR_PEP_ID=MMETSP1388-20130828/2353_1 /ASSEMBLY_ACC=CAM_ASM_000864 /TAXON_ID=37098 /ORGANISM="Isochrysis sp, Strain CCMP1244" /LENGTH=288 /DNA_ID=CAMNT_0049405319 /DNA_START=39 /DNA_END=906 /DNA_ORIENTATION=-